MREEKEAQNKEDKLKQTVEALLLFVDVSFSRSVEGMGGQSNSDGSQKGRGENSHCLGAQ